MKTVKSWSALAAIFIVCMSLSASGGAMPFREEAFGTSQALRHTYTNATRYNETTFLTSHNAFESFLHSYHHPWIASLRLR